MRNLLLDPDPEFRNLEELADWELQCLWADLPDAHRWTHGNNGHLIRSREWSMRCDALASRIRSFTLHIGPVSWQNIGVPLLFPDAPQPPDSDDVDELTDAELSYSDGQGDGDDTGSNVVQFSDGKSR